MWKPTSKVLIILCILTHTMWAQDFSEKGQEIGLPSTTAEQYKTLSEDGAWCWFSDPRAIYLNHKVYSGWVSADGSIMVASYNEVTGVAKEVNIAPQFNKDDHANPSFVILPDHRIMVFFTAHSTTGRGEDEPAITYAISTHPEDITEWEDQKKYTKNSKGPMGFCYTNPIMLSEENNRIYIFWRGGDWKPTFAYTDDQGLTWSGIYSLVKSSQETHKRPYMKVATNGKDEIHFAFTDGHPRNEPLNSIYYLKYKKGRFYSADGTELGTMNDLPLSHEDCDIVYDAHQEFRETSNGNRSWIWDVAVSSGGYPVVAYTKLPTESEHKYWYAHWSGTSWENYKISDAGSWFPRYEKDKSSREPEPHYSGGIYLDHENTNIVYYSKPVGDIFEIFKAETRNEGRTWMSTAITSNSKKDNVRPYSIRGAGENAGTQVIWMYNDRYAQYTDFDTRIKIDVKNPRP